MVPNESLDLARSELLEKVRGFSRVECDFGTSKGRFLTESAVLNPSVFFAGIEGLSDRVARTNRKIARMRLVNAAVWRGWGRESLEALIPEGFMDTLHVSFPDPWPKRRHWNRRLVNRDFLEVARSRLRPSGMLRLMTDHAGYFDAMQKHLAAQGGWIEVPWDDEVKRPVTEFEAIFLAKGDFIGRIAVIKDGESTDCLLSPLEIR